MKPEEMQVTPLVMPDGTHQGYVRGDGTVALFFSPAEKALREALRAAKKQLAERDERIAKLEQAIRVAREAASRIEGGSAWGYDSIPSPATQRLQMALRKANVQKPPAQSGHTPEEVTK